MGMGIVALILGILSIVLLPVGIFVWPAAFAAPILGLVATVLGGVAMSRAKRDGESSGAAIAGLVCGIIGFLLGAIEAVTCGVCGALCTAGMMMPRPDAGPNPWGNTNWNFGVYDAGPMPAFPTPPPVDPNAPPFPAPPDPGIQPGVTPALPPPPINPGPTGTQPQPPG